MTERSEGTPGLRHTTSSCARELPRGSDRGVHDSQQPASCNYATSSHTADEPWARLAHSPSPTLHQAGTTPLPRLRPSYGTTAESHRYPHLSHTPSTPHQSACTRERAQRSTEAVSAHHTTATPPIPTLSTLRSTHSSHTVGESVGYQATPNIPLARSFASLTRSPAHHTTHE